MSSIRIASLVTMLFALAGATAAAAPINGDVLVFVASSPLWSGSAFDIKDEKLAISLDGKKACGDIVFDRDNGWLCKADGHVTAGKHKVAVSFTDNGGKKHSLRATLNLKAADKKFEMPDAPTQGEQFWCVSITTTALGLLPKSDDRCHTD